MTLKIIRHSRLLIDITLNLSYCYRSHNRAACEWELFNIEFYDNFIICLFLFYDRFYRSLAFYTSACRACDSSLSHVWGLYCYFSCLFMVLGALFSPRGWFFWFLFFLSFSKLKNLSHTLFNIFVSAIFSVWRLKTQKEKGKKSLRNANSVNLIDVYFFTTSIKLTIKYDFLSFE